MKSSALKALLEAKYEEYNRPEFISKDPVQIPHRFSMKQDREIMGFFASILAWGQRTTIINKCEELIGLFGGSPYRFVMEHHPDDLRMLELFKHRTFGSTDLLYFIHFFRWYYQRHESLEDAFARFISKKDLNTENALAGFHDLFCSLEDFPARTRKHIATPARKSACKRLNMYLRWMVRQDDRGVDFGLWQRISPALLVCPLDVHVERVARRLGLLTRPQTDWLAALELTEKLRKLDRKDPVRYDFALFGLGLEEKGVLSVLAL